MGGDLTFTIIKPNVVKRRKIGDVVRLIEDGGFEIVAMKMTRLSRESAGQFYSIHREKSFFEPLVDFMVSDKIVVMALKKPNAVEAFREYIGSTNPSNAREGSIRRLYGENVTENAIHGSDSDENAMIEINFFFKNLE